LKHRIPLPRLPFSGSKG